MATECPLLAAALHYASRGWSVLPLHDVVQGYCSCREGLSCKSAGKHPRTRQGIKQASSVEATIRAWWGKWPNANVGIACGSQSDGLAVLDIDPRNGGDSSLEGLIAANDALPPTPEVRTGSGGAHYYLHAPDHRSSHGKIAEGIDFQARGAYVVAPPSLHQSGELYQWTVHPDEIELGPPPHWISVPATQTSNGKPTAHSGAPLSPGLSPPGTRRDMTDEELQEAVTIASAIVLILAEDRDTWLRIGMALHSSGNPLARDLWDAWAITCPEKFDVPGQDKTWRSFGVNHSGTGISLGTLFYIASEFGWHPSDSVSTAASDLLNSIPPTHTAPTPQPLDVTR